MVFALGEYVYLYCRFVGNFKMFYEQGVLKHGSKRTLTTAENARLQTTNMAACNLDLTFKLCQSVKKDVCLENVQSDGS